MFLWVCAIGLLALAATGGRGLLVFAGLAIGLLALAATVGGGLLVFVGLLLGGFVAGIFGTAGAAEVGVVSGGQVLCERGFIAACAGARARFFHSLGSTLDGELRAVAFS